MHCSYSTSLSFVSCAQGHALTIVETSSEPDLKKEEEEEEKKEDLAVPENLSAGRRQDVKESERVDVDIVAMSEKAQRIIEEAHARLNALARGEYNNETLHPGSSFEAGANARVLAAVGGLYGGEGEGEGATQVIMNGDLLH
jgi:hypothetical protein